MQLLRANTAVDVLIGPFVDATDGATAEISLTLDVELSKLGQALANKNDATTPVHDAAGTVDGHYNCELDATDTNTEGTLVLLAFDSAALIVRHEYMVMAEAAWDSMFVAKDTGFMDVNVKAVSEATSAADNLNSACDNYSTTRGLTGTALPAAVADAAGGVAISDAGGLDLDARLDAAVTSRLAPTVAGRTLDITAAGEAGIDLDNTSGTIAAAQIAANAITAAKIATDAITSTQLAASAAQKIRDEILPTQNVALPNIMFLFVRASDHVTPVTAASGTGVTRSIDDAAFAGGTGTLAEVANGIYQYDASAADMNGGIITFRFTATGGTPGAPDDKFLTIITGGGV